MPANSSIDKIYRIVVTKFIGVVTEEEIVEDRKKVLEDPDFDPTFSHLIDLRGVVHFQFSKFTLAKMAQHSIFVEGAKRAIIAPKDISYRLSREYEALSDSLKQQIVVFRTAKEAIIWLNHIIKRIVFIFLLPLYKL